MTNLTKIITILLMLTFPGMVWGATVYVKKISGTVYYESGASSCSDVTDADTRGTLEAAAGVAGVSGVCYVCPGTYSDSDLGGSGQLDLDEAGLTFEAVRTVTISSSISTAPVRLQAAVNFKGFSVTCPDLVGTNHGIYASDQSDGFEISNNIITCEGDTNGSQWRGISVFADGIVSNNTISQVRNGIMVHPDSGSGYAVLIIDNTISGLDAGTDASSDCVIFSGRSVNSFSGSIVCGNDCSGYKDDGIDLYWGSDITVRGNTIHDPNTHCSSGCDGHGIKCGSDSSSGNIIERNFLYNITDNNGIDANASDNVVIRNNVVLGVGEASANGIQIPVNTNGASVYNNTVVIESTGDALNFSSSATGTLIAKNNILDKGRSGGYDLDINKATVAGGYNCLRNDDAVHNEGGGSYSGHSDDLYQTDPLFENAGGASASDYRLQPDSPAIDSGTNTVGVLRDYEGRFRTSGSRVDIGAYEYVEVSVPPLLKTEPRDG